VTVLGPIPTVAKLMMALVALVAVVAHRTHLLHRIHLLLSRSIVLNPTI